MRELIVDSFAGGGGASSGIERALGRSPDIAINHNKHAIAMHKANHPNTEHYDCDIWHVNPREATRGRPVGLGWFSPDCTYYSKARGSKPFRQKGCEIRALAWTVINWARQVRPRVIILENVREFQAWGPVLPAWKCRGCKWRGVEGQTTLLRRSRRCPRCESRCLATTDEFLPDPTRKGLTFKRWLGNLRGLGYDVDHRDINAADYGAPTHRRRLFVIARCDKQPIVWPEPTHADPKKNTGLKPYRTAAECVDWDIACPSIFERERELAENTQRRIAFGMIRYVLNSPEPFIVRCNHGRDEFRGQSLDSPLPTVTGSRGDALVTPYMTRLGQTGGNGHYTNNIETPIGTVTSKNEHLLTAPVLIQTGYGERRGQDPRVLDLHQPHGTIVGSSGKSALAAALLTKFRGQCNGVPLDQPLPTITSGAGSRRPAGAPHAMAATAYYLSQFYGQSTGQSVLQPAPTLMQCNHTSLAAVYLARFNHGEKQWNSVGEPLGTITSQGNKFGLVYAFLVKFYGTAIGAPLTEPTHTITTGDRFAVVTVEVTPGVAEPAIAVNVPGFGWCIISDIGLRMLTPRELATAQGFPRTYVLFGSKAKQVAMIGNSVAPDVATALVAANYTSRRVRQRARVAV